MSTDKLRKMLPWPDDFKQSMFPNLLSRTQFRYYAASKIDTKFTVEGLKISEEALVAAAAYSNCYITDGFLPDEEIDLVDEAALALRLQQESKPDAIQQLDREIMTVQIELQSLRKETDIASSERREYLEETLKSKQNDPLKFSEIWNNKNYQIGAIKATKSLLDKAPIELYQARREGDVEKASRITYSEIPELVAELSNEDSRSSSNTNTNEFMGHDSVTIDDIAAVFSKTTEIPLNKLQSGEIEKLVYTEEILH